MPGVGLGQISSFSFLYSEAASMVKFSGVLSVLVTVTVTNKKAA